MPDVEQVGHDRGTPLHRDIREIRRASTPRWSDSAIVGDRTRSLPEIIDEFCDYANVHTVSYQPVFALRGNPYRPGKRSGVGTEPKNPG